MEIIQKSSVWWGPPRKFSTEIKERRVSWMELFYDLVYVVVISQITHHLTLHPNTSGLLDYIYFFTMIYWGWLNGSLYHDLHGAEGLRTRLMTMWQMMIVAALVITINTAGEHLLRHATIALMVMQVYITYIWWAVGFYDKAHRRLNKPYTILYLSSFGLMLITLFIHEEVWIKILFFGSLVLNYSPPFVVHRVHRETSQNMNLSASMTERMSLFTIIMFGEVVLGVVSGVSEQGQGLALIDWVNFALAVIIVFSLWWVFFILVADRSCKPGFFNSSLMQLVYIPTLMSLGILGAGFSSLFAHYTHPDPHFEWIFHFFKLSLAILFFGIAGIRWFLQYPEEYARLSRLSSWVLLATGTIFMVLAFVELNLSLFWYLLMVEGIIVALILSMNIQWYSLYLRQNEGI
jgi:low temperature requirement protein LtrA